MILKDLLRGSPLDTLGLEDRFLFFTAASGCSNQFIGVQVTRVTMKKQNGGATINKSKEEIISMLQKGFINTKYKPFLKHGYDFFF